MKKLVVGILALCLTLGQGVTSFAESVSTHTFTAYQIFSGTVSEGKFCSAEWGDGVDSAAFLAAIQSDSKLKDIYQGTVLRFLQPQHNNLIAIRIAWFCAILFYTKTA